MNDDLNKWLNPWPMFPQRSGESVGAGLERTMFGAVGADSWAPRTVVRKTHDGEVMMKTGGGLVSFQFKPNTGDEQAIVSAVWPLTERDYEERTHFAERATLSELGTGTFRYAPVASFIMLDVEGREVEFILKDAP